MICRMGIVGWFGALSVCVRSGSALLLTDRALSSTGEAKHRRANTGPVFLYVCMFACSFMCLSVCILFVCVLVLIDGQGGHFLSSQGKQNTGEPILGPSCLLRLASESQECLWDQIDGTKLPFTEYVADKRIFDTQSQHILWDKSAHSMSQSLSFLCCPQICKNTDSGRARHTQNIIGVKGHLWNADLCWCVATAGSADRNSKLQSWRLSKAMLICCTVQLWRHWSVALCNYEDT